MVHEKLFRSRKNKNPEPGFPVKSKDGKEVIWTPSTIKEKIMKSDEAVKHAILRIYTFQTLDEQQSEETSHSNSKGFGLYDAEILSSFAEQLKKRGFLSPKQIVIGRKKIQKYSRQLFEYIIEDFLNVLKPVIGEKNCFEMLRYNDWREKLSELARMGIVQWEKIEDFLGEKELEDNTTSRGLSSMGF